MKKKIFLFVTMISLTSFSQSSDIEICHDKLLNNQADSASHRISTSEFDAGSDERLDLKSSINAVSKVMEKVGCRIQNLKLDSVCTEIVKGSNRTACIVESDGMPGFFTLVKDYVDTFHVIYNRWD